MSEQSVMLEAGLAFHKRAAFDEANSCYQRVLDLDPECAQGWYLSGRLAMEVRLYEEAEALLGRAFELAPDKADYVLDLATVCAIRGKLEDAKAHFEKSLQLDPGRQEAYLGIANVLVLERHFDEALALIEPLVTLPGHLGEQARQVQGECVFERGDLQAAFNWWLKQGVDLSAGMVLHVGCGRATLSSLPAVFQGGNWGEIRLDIDPAVMPDIIASVSDMAAVASECAQAVYSCHNIEHLFHHEVPIALREFLRVLTPGGALVIRTPDLQAACQMVAEDRLYDTAYVSPAGPIAPIDMIYSYRNFLLDNNVFMLHKTGFTATTLRNKLIEAGFKYAFVRRTGFELYAVAFKDSLNNPSFQGGLS